jgi:histidine phosphotransferase ChpT
MSSELLQTSTAAASAQLPELWMTELLCSRLCHDVISPVGAVSNGLELVTEFGEGKDGDAMALVASSARQAVEKLSFFRVAYGQAGTRQTGMSFNDAAGLLEPMVAGPRVVMDWPTEYRPNDPMPAPGAIKLTLNLGLVAVEALPRGGTLKVTIVPENGGLALTISAIAPDARITEELTAALAGTIALQNLTPRTAQGALTRYLADRLSTRIQVSTTSEGPNAGVNFQTVLPAGS